MKKLMVMAGAFVVLGVLSGCGSGNAESIIKEQIKTTNELADLMGDIKKNDAEIKKTNQKLGELKTAFDKTPKDQQEAALKAHGADLLAANAKVAAKAMGGMGDLLKGIGGDLGKDLLKGGKDATDKAAKDAKDAADKAAKDLLPK